MFIVKRIIWIICARNCKTNVFKCVKFIQGKLYTLFPDTVYTLCIKKPDP